MTDPGRYDRPDPCEHCGEPHRGDCPRCWPEDLDWDAEHLGLRTVRDLRTGGEVL